MSDKEEDVSASGDRDVSTISSVYVSTENLSFATENVSPQDITPIKSSVLEKMPQQEAEERYCTPSFEKFLQWRCVDRSATPSEVSLMSDDIHDVDIPKTSACDMSLVARMNDLRLFTPKNERPLASPSTKVETTLVNVKSTLEKSIDLSSQTSHMAHIEYGGETEEKSILVRDETSEMKKEFADTEITSSDYSTMMLEMTTVLDKDSSSNMTFNNSSIDQISSREAENGASPECGIQSDFAEENDAKTKKVCESANAESTRLLDNSTSAPSHGQPSTLREEEVYETETCDTFDDLYNQNVVLTRRYVEKMVTKKRDGGCFQRFWSPRRMVCVSSPCRLFQEDKRIKERHRSRGSVKATSPENIRIVKTLLRVDGQECWKSPPLKLRRTRGNMQVQIPERANPGNTFHLGGKRSIDDYSVPGSNNNDSNLERRMFLHLPDKRYEIL